MSTETMENAKLTAKSESTMSQRFTAMVMREFGSSVGKPEITKHMRELIQGYFIAIDRALQVAEDARQRKKKNQDPVPVTWQNVNLPLLAVSVMRYAKIGIDMSVENHLFAIPYKNNKTQQYDVNLMLGYNGIQFIAEKYALDKPVSVTVELVYSNDGFTPIKRGRSNPVECYEFEITKPFDRGEIIGGFGYIEYDNPKKNRLITMTRAQMDKRRPKYASPEFWGGPKQVWENGSRTEVMLEGWTEEMYLKTLKREIYSAKNMPRDPDKMDEDYRLSIAADAMALEAASRPVMEGYADADIIDVSDMPAEAPNIDGQTRQEEDKANTPPEAPDAQEAPQAPEKGQMSFEGMAF